MRLVEPTDYEILSVLGDGKRNTAVNIATELGRNRGYINTRLPALKDFELVERVGPAERSGLYVITKKGESVIENRTGYGDEDAELSSDHDRESLDTAGD